MDASQWHRRSRLPTDGQKGVGAACPCDAFFARGGRRLPHRRCDDESFAYRRRRRESHQGPTSPACVQSQESTVATHLWASPQLASHLSAGSGSATRSSSRTCARERVGTSECKMRHDTSAARIKWWRAPAVTPAVIPAVGQGVEAAGRTASLHPPIGGEAVLAAFRLSPVRPHRDWQ